MQKIGQNWSCGGSRDPLFEFWDPMNMSGTVTGRNFKFGADMDGNEY